MALQVKSCYIFTDDQALSTVYLPDKQEVFVGRNVDTKITDLRCSRKQVRLYASYEQQKVFLEQLGTRPCGLNGFKTERGVKLIAQHGDRLEIIYGKYPYKVEFNPPPKIKAENEKTKVVKRLISQESDDEGKDVQETKKIKLEDDIYKDNITNKDHSNLPSTSFDNDNSKMSSSAKNGIWEQFDNNTLHVYTSAGCEGRSKIAAYDMDKTLIKTISGLEFPKDCNDWQLLYPEVPGKIKKYYQDGYKIVILSNQGGLGTGKVKLKDFKVKIERIVKKIGVPIQVYLAVGQSIYRKPRTGMWEHLVNKKNDGVPVEKENSFYVGDAAGRPADSLRKKKDHSLVDRLLAINIGLQFYTPEEHFLGHKKAPYNAPIFHPKEAITNTVLYEPQHITLIPGSQELIIMVGCPGSGKSHFAKTYLKDYYYINRDTLGSWQKCVAKTEEALNQGKNVVVDNTNPDKISRQRYINVAKKYKIPVRCFLMNLSKEHIKHNNMFRILTDSSHQQISDMIINSYIKNFVPPSEEEGFSEIIKINFVPSFKSEEDKKLYEMYLLE